MACLIKIAICDDDIELTSQLETIIKNFARNQNIHIETDIFFNGKSFMEYIENGFYLLSAEMYLFGATAHNE